ncbi:MAG: PTS sugar transporter subunit IIB [Elusimicrobiales bacterium]|jgi:mannose/fructose/N-acetylgalactosamine-specific phosphotransferase system component IIB|nr:PTS sugar transporter subunit IIB [Elusimicrobiales bacterium]
MPVSLFRVDDRLIHGQVVESWVPHLGVGEIVVASDEIAADETRQLLMRFAVPEGVELRIMRLDEAAPYIAAGASERKTLVLVPGIREMAALLDGGVRPASVNIGGMHYSAGRNMSIGKAIFLSDEDCADLKKLAAAGIRLEGRGVPSDKPFDLMEAIA